MELEAARCICVHPYLSLLICVKITCFLDQAAAA
jgi:hypothetical protein